MQCAANLHKSFHKIPLLYVDLAKTVCLYNIFEIYSTIVIIFWVELSAPEEIDEMKFGFIAGGEPS